MDLKKFYFENVSEKDYYYKFYDLIANTNAPEEVNDDKFIIYDIDDAIYKFKSLCQPENEIHNDKDKCLFYLILFYLNKCGYTIKEFPEVIKRPPIDSYEFVNKAIRGKVLGDGKDDNGIVRYSERRKLIETLTFEKMDNHIEIPYNVDRKFEEISNRQTTFQNMSTNERLVEIANLIENLLKKNGTFLSPDYSQICFDFINEDTIKKYRKKLQCFRHSSSESIKERESFTDEQKTFFIDFGLTISKVICSLLHNK